MDERGSFYMDKSIKEPWLLEMDHDNDEIIEPPQNRYNAPDKVSISNSKYYNLLCNCGLVDEIATFQKLRTQIYFDTSTKNIYKSDINSTTILPDGFPYMECPRHNQYFADVIRCHMSSIEHRSDAVHLKIVLFDATSQNNYALSKPNKYATPNEYGTSNIHPTYTFDEDEDEAEDDFEDHVDAINHSINSSVDNRHSHSNSMFSRGRRRRRYLGNNKHFIECNAFSDDKQVCDCKEKREAYNIRYIREHSVVADVLHDYGVDFILPTEDIQMMENSEHLIGGDRIISSKIAKARWVRTDRRKEFPSKKKNNSGLRFLSTKDRDSSLVDFFPDTYMNESETALNFESNMPTGYDLLYSPTPNFYTEDCLSFEKYLVDEKELYAARKKREEEAKLNEFSVLAQPRKKYYVPTDSLDWEPNRITYRDRDGRIKKSRWFSYSQYRDKSRREELRNWVTVIGFQPKCIAKIVQLMGSLGPIIQIRSSRKCNFVHLMYSKSHFADDAIKRGTIKLDDSTIVSVKPCTDTLLPDEQVHCLDPAKHPWEYSSYWSPSTYYHLFTWAVYKVAKYIDNFMNEL